MLELTDPHDDWQAFENAVRSTCFKGHDTSDYNRCKLANSTRFGMIAYGIVARDAKLTDSRRKLIAMNDDQPIHYQRLAKHILLNLHRSTVVSCARGMAAAGKLSHSTPCATGLAARRVHCTALADVRAWCAFGLPRRAYRWDSKITLS